MRLERRDQRLPLLERDREAIDVAGLFELAVDDDRRAFQDLRLLRLVVRLFLHHLGQHADDERPQRARAFGVVARSQ